MLETKRRARDDVPEHDDDLLRLAEVVRRVGLSRSTIYKRVGEGTFPAPKQLGGGVARWRRGTLRDWAAALPQAPAGTPPGGR